MRSLNEAFESLDKIYEGYDTTVNAQLAPEEIKKAQDEFKKLNKKGILDYDVFHRAYDAALATSAAGSIDQIFDDEGKLKGKYVYGAIKAIYPRTLSDILKQLWALAFVDNVVANRQEYTNKRKAEREQLKAGQEVYDRDADIFESERLAVTKRCEEENKNQAKILADLADKTFSAEFKKRYLEICKVATLADCIQVDLHYQPSVKMLCLKEGIDYAKPETELKGIFYGDTANAAISATKVEKSAEGTQYYNYSKKPTYLVKYTYNEDAPAKAFPVERLKEVFSKFEQTNQPIITEADHMSQYKTWYTVADLWEGRPEQAAVEKFIKTNIINSVYVQLSNGKILRAALDTNVDTKDKLALDKDVIKLLAENKITDIYAIEYNSTGTSRYANNDIHGAFSAERHWRVALTNNCPANLRGSLEVDKPAMFGNTGGEEVKPTAEEAALGFDHYFEMEYMIDTSD